VLRGALSLPAPFFVTTQRPSASAKPHDADATVRNIAAWDALYGSTRRLIWGPHPVGFLPQILKELGPVQPDDRVLDAAAGEGRNLPELRRLGGRLHACDASASALEKIPPALRADVEVTVCDLRALPFPDGFFRFVLLCDVVETLPEIDVPLRELARVLAPGGHLLCNIPGLDDGIAGVDMTPLGGGGYLYRGRYFYRFLGQMEACALLESHGLKVARMHDCRWHERPHPNFRPTSHLHVSRVFLATRVAVPRKPS
jgi:SAM-dependent methyltransferase